MTKPLVLLDFDGVLFDSVPEVYAVCMKVCSTFPVEYDLVKFDEFKRFRAYLTDAWQFNRLFSKNLGLNDFSSLADIAPIEEDWLFTQRFFEARKILMEDPDWASSMIPFEFFENIQYLLKGHADHFVIISTRNEQSIKATLSYYNVNDIRVYGQSAVRSSGSKLNALRTANVLSERDYVLYIDDMRSHLEPFHDVINLCMQADWGYDSSTLGAFSQRQVTQIIKSYFRSSDMN